SSSGASGFPRTSVRRSIGIGAIRFLLLRSPVNAIAAHARRAGRGGGLHAAKRVARHVRGRLRRIRAQQINGKVVSRLGPAVPLCIVNKKLLPRAYEVRVRAQAPRAFRPTDDS